MAMTTDGYGNVIGAVNEQNYTNVRGVFSLMEVSNLRRKGKWPTNVFIGGVGNQAFTTPGNAQFTVPANVSVIRVEMWGAAGGSGVNVSSPSNYSGPGGYVKCDIAVTPGEVLDLIIGGGGQAGLGSSASAPTSAPGGGGKGGYQNTSNRAGGGGGRCEIKRGTTVLAVAPGGGGCGNGITGTDVCGGGPGGGATGGSPSIGDGTSGGTQSAPGAGGSGNGGSGSNGSNGSGSTGGDGGPNNGTSGTAPGGGGGGGYFGGGGGGCQNPGAGGAGGSSYYHPTLTANQSTASGSGSTPGGNTSPNYVSPYGQAVLMVNGTGPGNTGNGGRIYIEW